MPDQFVGNVSIDATDMDQDFKLYYYQDSKLLFEEDHLIKNSIPIRQDTLVRFTVKLAYLINTCNFFRINDLDNGFKTEDLRSNLDVINEGLLRIKLSLIEQYTEHLRMFLLGKNPFAKDVGYLIVADSTIYDSRILKKTLPSMALEFIITKCKNSTSTHSNCENPIPLSDRSIKELYYAGAVLYAHSFNLYQNFPSYRYPQCLDSFGYNLEDDFMLETRYLKSYTTLINEYCGKPRSKQQYYLSACLAYQVTRALLYSYLIDHRFDPFPKSSNDDTDTLEYNQDLELHDPSKFHAYTLTSYIYTPTEFSLETDTKYFSCSMVYNHVSGQIFVGDVKDTVKQSPISPSLKTQEQLSMYTTLSARMDQLQSQLTNMTETIEGLKSDLTAILLRGNQDHKE